MTAISSCNVIIGYHINLVISKADVPYSICTTCPRDYPTASSHSESEGPHKGEAAEGSATLTDKSLADVSVMSFNSDKLSTGTYTVGCLA